MMLPFEHQDTGRNPTVLFGLAMSACLALSTDMTEMPLFVWLLWMPATLALLYIYVVNPISGCRVANGTWVCYTTEGRATIPLTAIRHVQLCAWKRGGEICRIHLVDGRVLVVPSDCLPRNDRLATVLSAAGVAIERN